MLHTGLVCPCVVWPSCRRGQTWVDPAADVGLCTLACVLQSCIHGVHSYRRVSAMPTTVACSTPIGRKLRLGTKALQTVFVRHERPTGHCRAAARLSLRLHCTCYWVYLWHREHLQQYRRIHLFVYCVEREVCCHGIA